jgi:acetylornithine deacetylase/succinyl-diaminopimelate desuccinylase-like protein
MLTGGTDSKHFAPLSRGGVLRFTPYQMNRTAGELDTVHATNERARLSDLALAICTYERLMQLLASNAP